MPRTNKSIYAALTANIIIAATKFIAGGISKSSAMISEAVHTLADCFNELFLLLGIYRSNKKRDKTHPFGYGKELYFWSFIVSILIFGLGAGASFYQGIVHLRHPRLPGQLTLSYIVLACAFISEGASFVIALKEFNKIRGDQSFWAAVRSSKDPTDFIVLFEDGTAVIGVVLVFISLFAGHLLKNPYLDGIASILVGLLLTASSAVLARESRSLLMGEGISPVTERKIVSIVKSDPGVVDIFRVFSIYESPDEVLIVLLISFKPELTTSQMNDTITRIKERIRGQFKKINYIIIQPQADKESLPALAG